MFDYTTENVLNDLSRVSVVNDSATLAAPGTVTPTGSTTGGTLAAATYYYKVTALTPKGETTPSPEANVTTTGTTSSVGLAWAAITGATGYNIYRGTATGAENVQYTTTTNSFSDTGAAGVTDTPPTANTAYIVTDQGVPGGDSALVIKRLNKYLKSRAGKVYKRAATSPVKEVNTTTLPATGNVGDAVYRLNVSVTMSGSYPIDYDRWAINKGKPFFVEVYVPAGTYTGAQLATALLPGLVKGLKKYNGQNISDIVPTVSGANVIITAQNEYQRLSVLIETEDAAGENWTTVATGTTTTSGVEGFGTAWFITKNLRIPTQEATRFFGENQDELPVNGVLYNQYTFSYEADRNFTGQGAVGQMIRSKTTHVIFVPSTLASTFEGYITSAFGAGSILDPVTNQAIN